MVRKLTVPAMVRKLTVPAMVRKLTVAFFALAIVIAGGGFVRARTDGGDAPRNGGSYGRASTTVQIALWKRKAEADPHDFLSRTNLANAYLDHARDVGDLTAYDSAQRALDEALAIKPDHLPAQASLAALRFATHDFDQASQIARRVSEEDPTALSALAIVGDADLELGRYDEAASIYADLAAKAPGPAIWGRQARLDFVLGRTDAALDGARRSARESDARDDVTAESKARAHVQAATYAIQLGRKDVAADELAAARRQAPTFFLADATAARLAATEGKWSEAVHGYDAAVAVLPEPTWIGALGDIAMARGDAAAAEQQFRAVEGIAGVGERLGQLYNRQLALFLADHDRDPQRAFDLANAEVQRRQDVFGWDALAWTALKANRLDVARDAAAKATATGTQDPALLYHAGMVAKAAGDVGRARTLLTGALGIDPGFDPVQAPLARQALAGLDRS
jgi:tetratricopeptide (TPR) repeat protein